MDKGDLAFAIGMLASLVLSAGILVLYFNGIGL